MRPYIDRCQDLPNGIDGYLPKSASDVADHGSGDEVDAALAVPLGSPRRSGSPRPTRSICLTTAPRPDSLLRRLQLGLGDAIEAIESGFLDTDVFTDHFRRDAGVAKSQRQRIRQRKFA